MSYAMPPPRPRKSTTVTGMLGGFLLALPLGWLLHRCVVGMHGPRIEPSEPTGSFWTWVLGLVLVCVPIGFLSGRLKGIPLGLGLVWGFGFGGLFFMSPRSQHLAGQIFLDEDLDVLPAAMGALLLGGLFLGATLGLVIVARRAARRGRGPGGVQTLGLLVVPLLVLAGLGATGRLVKLESTARTPMSPTDIRFVLDSLPLLLLATAILALAGLLAARWPVGGFLGGAAVMGAGLVMTGAWESLGQDAQKGLHDALHSLTGDGASLYSWSYWVLLGAATMAMGIAGFQAAAAGKGVWWRNGGQAAGHGTPPSGRPGWGPVPVAPVALAAPEPAYASAGSWEHGVAADDVATEAAPLVSAPPSPAPPLGYPAQRTEPLEPVGRDETSPWVRPVREGEQPASDEGDTHPGSDRSRPQWPGAN